MYWRGFGVLCVLGAKLFTPGVGSEIIYPRNGTTVVKVGGGGVVKGENGDVGVGDGRGGWSRLEAATLERRVSSVELADVATSSKTVEGWKMATVEAEKLRDETSRTTEVSISTTVKSVSTCMPFSTLSESRYSSSEESSIILLSSSMSGSNVCGWLEETSTVVVEKTVSATRTVEAGKAFSESTMGGSKRRTGDGVPSPTLPVTGVEQTIAAERTDQSTWIGSTRSTGPISTKFRTSIQQPVTTGQSTSARASAKSTKRPEPHTTADIGKQGSTSTPFRTLAASTGAATSAEASTSSLDGEVKQEENNNTVAFKVDERELEENNTGGKLEAQVTIDHAIKGTMALVVDDDMSLRSNATMMENRATEALQTSVSTIVSSTSTILDAHAMKSDNITSSVAGQKMGDGVASSNSTTNEPHSHGAANEASQKSSATTPEASSATSSNLTAFGTGGEEGVAGPSNIVKVTVLSTVTDNDTFLDVIESFNLPNATADRAPLALNATLAATMEPSAENKATLTTSSVLPLANGTIVPDAEMRNTTLISSALSAINMLLSTPSVEGSSTNTSSAMVPGINGSIGRLDGLGNNSSFMPANHSADILRILAGNPTKTPLNTTVSLVVFALPCDQSMVEDVTNINNTTSGAGKPFNATYSQMGSEMAMPNPASALANARLNQTTATIVGDPSIPLNDTKLREYGTLYKISETKMEMGGENGCLMSGNSTGLGVVENSSVLLNDSALNQSDAQESTAFISPLGRNDTANMVGMDGNLNPSLVLGGLNKSNGMNVVVGNATSTLANTAAFVASTLLNGTVGRETILNPTIGGVFAGKNATVLHEQIVGNGTDERMNLTAPTPSLLDDTSNALPTVSGNATGLALVIGTNATKGTVLSGTTAFALMSADPMSRTVEEAMDGMNRNVTVSSVNATSLSAFEAGMAGNVTTISNGTAPGQRGIVFLSAINSADLADAQVRRYIQRLENALHISQGNLKDVVCTDESLLNGQERLSREEFELVEQACLKLWESQAGLAMNETIDISTMEAIANVTDRIIPEASLSNATAADKLRGYPSLVNFTESDGNAPERLGPARTSTTALPTASFSMTDSSSVQPATETILGTSSPIMSTLSTSFTSASSLPNSKTTSTSSSMRPKMTACVDDFDFFDMTDANLDESGTIAWYMNWTAISAAQDGKFNSLGEVRYFGQTWLKDPDYDCGLEHGGCTRRPSCNSILSIYPDDAKLARRVYFVMKMHSTINTVMKSYYDAIQLTHQNVAAQIHTIISTTMQTPHFDDAAACKFLQTSYSNIQTIIIDLYQPRTTMEGKGWNDPWFVDELKYTTPSAQGIWWLQYPDPITHKEKGMTKWVHGRLMMLYRMWFKDSIGRMDASMKLCDGLGIVNQDKAGTEEKLKVALSKFSTYQRKELSKHVQELNKGKFYGEGDPSVLSSMLTMGIWNNEETSQGVLNVLSDPYQLEEMMTNQSKEGILSQSYIQQKCYMKCTSHPHASLLCEGFNDWEFSTKHNLKHGGTPADGKYYEQTGPMSGLSEAEKNMRICPEPDKVCQVECWSQEKKGWSMPLHGINRLGSEPLGVDIQQKMKEIYAYYKENGNASPYGQSQDPAKDMEANLNDLHKTRPPPKGPHFWLPVCDSDQGYTHIVDFGQQRHSKYNLKQHSRGLDQRSFPVSCGSFRSDQTVEFMEAMGLTNHHSRDVSWTMDPFFQNYAALNVAVLIEAPLDNFLAFCALGIAYPQSDLMDSKHGELGIIREGSRWCEPIAQETEGMGWYMANLWFCRKSPNARQLFKSQGMSGAIVGLHKIKNHRALCRRWLAQAQGEAMGGLDEIDGSQSKDRKVGAKAIGFPNKIDAYGDRSGKGGKHGHAPVTEDGRSKGWFDVMNRKKGNGKRNGAAESEEEYREERKAVRQEEEAAKRKDKKVVEDVQVDIDLEEARREEEAYWEDFAALKDDYGVNELYNE